MKLRSLIFTATVFTSAVSAFSPSNPSGSGVLQNVVRPSISDRGSPLAAATMGGTINIEDHTAQRDVPGMANWAMQCGVQKADGVEPYSADGNDWQLVASQNIASGSPVLFVPGNMVLSSNAVVNEFGGSLQQAENALVESEKGLAQRLPLFRLMVKILAEYEKGQNSPYFPWMNSLPRQFYNGVAMTGK